MPFIALSNVKCPFCEGPLYSGKIRAPSYFDPTFVKVKCKGHYDGEGIAKEGCLCDILLKVKRVRKAESKIEVIDVSFSEKAKLILLERDKKNKKHRMGDRMGGS